MTISIVIPVYNEEAIIADCLDSLMAQSRPADEILIVDNNSTDHTIAIARQYGARVVSETTQGIPPAVHTGLSAARGDVRVRCDADSILPPRWIESIERVFQEHPSAVAATGPGHFMGTSKVVALVADWLYMKAYFASVYLATANVPLFGSNFAIRAECWEAIKDSAHRDRTDIHDDMDISMHIDPTMRIVYAPSMAAGMSARALAPRGLPRRYARGFKSLFIHWPQQAPWVRWRRRLFHSRRS